MPQHTISLCDTNSCYSDNIGGFSQTITTVAGQTYAATYAVADGWFHAKTDKTGTNYFMAKDQATGAVLVDVGHTTSASAHNDNGHLGQWDVVGPIVFEATGARTDIAFYSQESLHQHRQRRC